MYTARKVMQAHLMNVLGVHLFFTVRHLPVSSQNPLTRALWCSGVSAHPTAPPSTLGGVGGDGETPPA